MELRERFNEIGTNPALLAKMINWYQQLYRSAYRKYGRGLNPLHTSGNDRSNKVLGNRPFPSVTQAELQTFGGVHHLNQCNDYYELTNASHATDKKLLVRGEGIPFDATITWRHAQHAKAIFFVAQPIHNPELCRLDLLCARLEFVSTFWIAVTETTLRQRLDHKGIQPLNAEGLRVLFHYTLEEASCLEGTEADQHRVAARTFMQCIQTQYPTLYPSLAQQYSVAVMSLYRDEARDIPRWAAQGLFQLDAVDQAVQMIGIFNATDTNLFRPASTREDQRFNALQAMSVVPKPPHTTAPAPAPATAPAETPVRDPKPPGDHNPYGPPLLKRTPRHLRPPFPAEEYFRAPTAGEPTCTSCHMPGHDETKCRIYDHEQIKASGRKSLQWFDLAKEPRDYQDKLVAYLKAYGPVKDQGASGADFVDRRMEETREAMAREAQERDQQGPGRRGIGFKRQRGGRGPN
jgi:hypothetical protein